MKNINNGWQAAAELTVATFGSPSELLEFISWTLGDVNRQLKKEERDSCIFGIRVIIDHILTAWVKTGNDLEDRLKKGWHNLVVDIHPGGYRDTVILIQLALTKGSADAIDTEEWTSNRMKHLSGLHSIYYRLEETWSAEKRSIE